MTREEWKVVTENWVYRNPFHQAGVWRCRRRNIATGKVESFIVRDHDTGLNARTLKQAQRLVAAKAGKPEEVTTNTESTATNDSPMSIADAVKKYLDEQEVRPGTLEDYRLALEKITRMLADDGVTTLRTIGNDGRMIDAVNREHIVKLLKSGENRGKKWSARNRQKYTFLLRSFFDWSIDAGLTEGNPARRFKAPKAWRNALKENRDRGIPLTEDQARSLLRACREPFGVMSDEKKLRDKAPPSYLYLVVMIALRSGLRLGNILGLRVEHLKTDCTEFDIPGSELKNHERLHVPVHPELQPLLREVLRRLAGKLGHAPSGKDYVIEDTDSVRRSFDNAVKRAGLEKIDGKRLRFHDCRHAFSSWLATRVTEAVKDVLMGHARTTVSSRYVHLGIQELREELNKLPWLEPKAAVAEKVRQG